MASYRPLELTTITAKGLKDVKLLSEMDVYAVAWLSNDPAVRQRTPTDRDGGRNPSWSNATLRFFVPEGADIGRIVLHVQLRCERSLGDRDIGEVHVPLKDLESFSDAREIVSHEIRHPSGKPEGVLTFSFKFGDPVVVPAQLPDPAAAQYPALAAAAAYPTPGADSKGGKPVTVDRARPSAPPPPGHRGYGALPPPPPPPGYGYLPTPPGYAYLPTPPGYGYLPTPPGYGYPPPPGYGYGAPPAPPKKNKFGSVLRAWWFFHGIGDVISDVAGYDAGFDDPGWFDF